jgi:regulatory protein
VSELRRALARSGYEEGVVDAVLDRLTRAGYLSDGRFAEAFARSRLTRHGLGRNRIRQDLARRGVERPEVDKALKGVLADSPEGETIDALARRFWSRKSADPPPLRLRKLWAFLVRRGFPSSLVHDRLHHLWPRWSDALEGLEPQADDQ